MLAPGPQRPQGMSAEAVVDQARKIGLLPSRFGACCITSAAAAAGDVLVGGYTALIGIAAALKLSSMLAVSCLALAFLYFSVSVVVLQSRSRSLTVYELVRATGTVIISLSASVALAKAHRRYWEDIAVSLQLELWQGQWLIQMMIYEGSRKFAANLLSATTFFKLMSLSSQFCRIQCGRALLVTLLLALLLITTVIVTEGYLTVNDATISWFDRSVGGDLPADIPADLTEGVWDMGVPHQEILKPLGTWELNAATYLDVRQRPFTPKLILRRPLLRNEWHALTLGHDNKVRTHIGFEKFVSFPVELVVAYCPDLAFVPVRQDEFKYTCGAHRLVSGVKMKHYVAGLTIFGASPKFGINSMHDRIDSFPVLNQSLALWSEIGQPASMNLFCAPKQCDILRRSGRQLRLVEETRILQHVGYHFQHAILPIWTTEVGGHKMGSIYPPGSYSLAAAEEFVFSKTMVSPHPYILYVSRRYQRSRKFPTSEEDVLLSRLNESLIAAFRKQAVLQVFARPSKELSEENLKRDARLFQGASAVIGWHGGGLSNLIHCRPGTVVIEGHLKNPHGRLHYTSVAYASGLQYFVYTAPHDDSWYYLDGRELPWVKDFMAFAKNVLHVTGVLS